MDRHQKLVRILFATGIVCVAGLVLVYGYSVLLFQEVPPAWDGWLTTVGYASAAILAVTGFGLLFDRSAQLSVRILLPFLLLWLLTRIPVVLTDPLREISWFAIGEIAVPVSAALTLYVWLSGPGAASRLQRAAATYGPVVTRILVGGSIITFGLSHFFEFAARTVSLVPAWLPFRTAVADLAGGAQVAAGLGVLCNVQPRLAAAAEAGMLSLFALLVWVPAVISRPGLQSNWVEFLVTWELAAACWVVAEGFRRRLATSRLT